MNPTPESQQLTPEEITALRELAQNLMAAGRVKRVLTGWLLWLASVIGAGYLVWDFWLKAKGK